MVTWQVWIGDQHCGGLLHSTTLVLCILAHRYTSDGGDDELGKRDILWRAAYRCGILPCEGKA